MPVVTLLIIVAVIGVIVWLIRTYAPMDPAFKTAVLAIGLAVALLVVLGAFGVLDSVLSLRIGGGGIRR